MVNACLRTKAEPGIFYRPAKASDETDKLLENREKVIKLLRFSSYWSFPWCIVIVIAVLSLFLL